jgi:hypothetical protein
MKRNDKIITMLAITMIISASVGIYLLNPLQRKEPNTSSIEDFFSFTGIYSALPNAISVTNENALAALIATPLAINYDEKGNQNVRPLYIKDMGTASKAILRAEEEIGISADLILDNDKSNKDLSIEIAETYWKSSDAAIIIKNDQSGYNIGVIVAPIASYLGIPILVTDKIDQEIENCLTKLKIKKTIICGNLENRENSLTLKNADEVVNATIKLVENKFEKVDYVTITNPIDTRTPEVLDTEIVEIGPVKLSTISTFQLGKLLTTMLSKQTSSSRGSDGVNIKSPQFEIGSFTIPADYKYALIKFEGINLNPEHVDLIGDHVEFKVPGLKMGSTQSTPSEHGLDGTTTMDRYYSEHVLYNKGGTEYPISASPYWAAKKEGEVKVRIVIEKLSDPLYPMMKGLSSIAPYLTAYRKGIVVGKPEYAFVVDDEVRSEEGEPCPGMYMSRYNPALQAPTNNHIYENIHKPLNALLAKIANINIDELEDLRDHYAENPMYIALVGGVTVLPQFVYDSAVLKKQGTASDVIYGNIDPIEGWENCQDDVYTRYPYQENIVGRITGWDAQDVSALVARTVFYDKLLQNLETWKNTATILTGMGTDFAKPKGLMKILNWVGGSEHVVEGYEEPLRWPTGCSEISGDALQKQNLEPMEFDVIRLKKFQSSLKGLSNEAIKILKKTSIQTLLTLSMAQLKLLFGEDKVKGGEAHINSNFIFLHGHGAPDLVNLGNEGVAGLGMGYIILPWLLQVASHILKYGPGSSINTGVYNVRGVENLNLGPSFVWFETCFAAWIDGRHPQTCLSQAYLHAGANALVISTTPSSVPGGYLEPYRPYSTILGTIPGYIKAKMNEKNGIYPEHHFGEKLYADMLHDLEGNDSTIGLALRNSRNKYLPEDADYTMYWTPPLPDSSERKTLLGRIMDKIEERISGYEKLSFMENKYVNYQEFLLYGDPAFNPYEPCNHG